MTRIWTTLAASVLVIAGGAVHGYWTDRWQPPVAADEAAGRMAALPTDIGDWAGSPLDVKDPHAGGVAGTLQRRYDNRRTGDAVTVMLLCGRAGPVSIHTPEACYGASGFTFGGKSKAAVREHGGDFWTADATKTTPTGETRMRIYWGWNDGKGWAAPDDARWTYVAYRRAPVLYKLYVLRDLGGPPRTAKDDPCQAFLEAALPDLDSTLFAPGS